MEGAAVSQDEMGLKTLGGYFSLSLSIRSQTFITIVVVTVATWLVCDLCPPHRYSYPQPAVGLARLYSPVGAIRLLKDITSRY